MTFEVTEMPNKPRPDNPHRSVRVEDELWNASGEIARANGTTRAAVIQAALLEYVEQAITNPPPRAR